MSSDQNKFPLVSVLMTAFNREKFIAESIESVLASTMQDFELIIVDDASTDSTVEIATKYVLADERVQLHINSENIGDYPNRNKAASFAKGRYLKYVDSDDVLKPDGLAVMVDAMEAYPTAGFGFSELRTESSSYPYCYTGQSALRKHFLGGGLLQAGPSTTIIRRAAFIKIGGFTSKRFISDYEAWLTLCLYFPVVIFSPGLIWIRDHQGQEKDLGKLHYYSLNYNLHKDFIKNTNNPFTENERSKILFNYKVLLGRRVYQRLLPKYGLKKVLQTIKAAGENYLVFIYALLPMKKR